jgi:hypothetical protein
MFHTMSDACTVVIGLLYASQYFLFINLQWKEQSTQQGININIKIDVYY